LASVKTSYKNKSEKLESDLIPHVIFWYIVTYVMPCFCSVLPGVEPLSVPLPSLICQTYASVLLYVQSLVHAVFVTQHAIFDFG
jgi:hypothetical protein